MAGKSEKATKRPDAAAGCEFVDDRIRVREGPISPRGAA